MIHDNERGDIERLDYFSSIARIWTVATTEDGKGSGSDEVMDAERAEGRTEVGLQVTTKKGVQAEFHSFVENLYAC